MEDSEKAYWERHLKERFVIGEQLGRSGASTCAYRVYEKETGKSSVLLVPSEEILTDSDSSQMYMKKQRQAEEIKAFCISGYTGNVFIPTAEFGEVYRIMPYAGEDFTPQIYESLSKQDQERLAFDLASYLNFVHQKSFDEKELLAQKSSSKIGKKAKDFYIKIELESYMKGKIPDTEYKKLQQLIDDFKQRDTADEINVMTHGDLRYQNILYDKTTKKLAVIDYETAAISNIYKDFCPSVASSLPVQFIKDVIRFYNELPKKHPVSVDEKKISQMQAVFRVRELVYCGMIRGRNPLKTLYDIQREGILGPCVLTEQNFEAKRRQIINPRFRQYE